MLIKRKSGIEIPSSEITPAHIYRSRRQFMKGVGAIAAGSLLAACRPERPPSTTGGDEPVAEVVVTDGEGSSEVSEVVVETAPVVSATVDELGNNLNSLDEITNYNNYYEFTTKKEEVAQVAKDFNTDGWQVEVGGMVRNAGIYNMSDLLTKFDQEERIYRMRCVEAWSMVIPWNGFPLSKLLNEVEPTSDAKYVRFETAFLPDQMPGLSSPWYEWPYVEGLTIDEAMNDLAILATGIYGQELTPQNGAPVRLVVPWKYGFKGIKSIVKIELTDQQPTSLWMAAAPNEYGFYSNVNPNVSHPRWTQASERRIGTSGRIPTLMFNGYEEQVAYLYEGLDLQENF